MIYFLYAIDWLRSTLVNKVERIAYERELCLAEWDSFDCKECLLWVMHGCGVGFVKRGLAP